MQPLHSALQPEIQQAQKTTRTWRTTRCRTPRKNRSPETIQTATAAHTRYPSLPAAATLFNLHGKIQGFVLRLHPQKQTPCNSHAAITKTLSTMRFAATRTHPCSHYMPLQCDLHPHVAEHQARTDYTRNDPNRNRRTQKVPFIAACSDFTRKSMRFRAPALIPPKHKSHATFMYTGSTMSFAAPCTHSCRHYNAIRIPALQNTKGEPMTRWNDPNRNRRTQEVPFMAACSHFTRKNTRFRSPASSPTRVPCNSHAAITMRFAAVFLWDVSSCDVVMWCIVMRCLVMWCIVVCCIVMWCIVMWCIVMWCIVMWCIVMWCIVMWWIVMWCIVMWRIVVWCIVTVYDVLQCGVLLCDVLLCDVLLCDVLLCDVLSCDVLLCDVLYCYVMYCYMISC